MKVETFLQHCNSREKFTPEEEADARKFFVDRGVRYIRDWYSQPFKPELITELFEGWKALGKTTYTVGFWKIEFGVYKSVNAMRIKGMQKESTNYSPSTLDEFISDCTRSGIELKWKEIETNKENQ